MTNYRIYKHKYETDMLQYNLTIGASDEYSFGELAQMAIEGGCRWIQVSDPDKAGPDVLRNEISGIIDLCKESSVILTVVDNIDLAKDLGIHGVRLTADAGRSAASVREEFGPEAIIGADVSSAAAIGMLAAQDIDYAVLTTDIPAAERSIIISQAHETGCRLPIVIAGDLTPDTALEEVAAGASGVCLGAYISRAKDPIAATQDVITAITSL